MFQPSARNTQKIDPQVWELHKTRIIELWLPPTATLKSVIRTIEEETGFVASEKQYRYQLELWKIRKNWTTSELDHIENVWKQRDAAGKQTRVKRNGVKIPKESIKQKKHRRFVSTIDAKRRELYNARDDDLAEDASSAPALGFDFDIGTPTTVTDNPTPSTNLLSPELSNSNLMATEDSRTEEHIVGVMDSTAVKPMDFVHVKHELQRLLRSIGGISIHMPQRPTTLPQPIIASIYALDRLKTLNHQDIMSFLECCQARFPIQICSDVRHLITTLQPHFVDNCYEINFAEHRWFNNSKLKSMYCTVNLMLRNYQDNYELVETTIPSHVATMHDAVCREQIPGSSFPHTDEHLLTIGGFPVLFEDEYHALRREMALSRPALRFEPCLETPRLVVGRSFELRILKLGWYLAIDWLGSPFY